MGKSASNYCSHCRCCRLLARPEDHLQHFLEFANFYHCFIRSFSSVLAPHSALLKGKPRRLPWNNAAQSAFEHLKCLFITAPILKIPDPTKPFIVKVDTSSIGVEAVLSQRQGEPPKMFPCAFFYRKLTTTARNYNMGNRKLLVVKLALE